MKNLLTLLLLFTGLLLNGQCITGDCNNGEGTMLYKSGNKYQGNFKDGKKNGYGKFIWVSGAKYKGDWVQNKRNGRGEEFLADGSKYIGQFKNDLKHGQGTLFGANGESLKEGKWVNGNFTSSTKTSKKTSPTKTSNTSYASNGPRWLNVGVGTSSTFGGGFASGGSSSGIPPISISYDFKKLDNGISIGGYLGYTSDKITYNDNFYGDWGYKTSYIILGARGTYSYDLFNNPKMDTYVGAMVGYNVVNSSYFGDDLFSSQSTASASGITYSGFLGLRYLFNDSMGAFGELGYGISYFTVGVTKKF